MNLLQSSGLRRAGALVVATAITSTTLLSVAGPAQAHPAGDRAVSASATWLKSQLTAGILHNEEYDYDDLGLSADIAFALDAVGGHDATVNQVVDAIEPVSESWVGGFTPGRVYAGSLAKMASVVQAAGQDPEDYNGTDQVSRLEGLVSSSAPLTGRLEDAGVDLTDPYDADFVNVIGQSFAVRALVTAGSGRAADATSFLLKQQCDAGFFRATLTADKSSTEQGCVSGTHNGSVDTTALTVINILDTPGASTAAKGAAAFAATWLKGQQAADGSFTAGGTEGYNANSTGLAGWALAKAGFDSASTKAATWLRGQQVADLAPCASALATDNGAVLLKSEEVTAVRTAGVPRRPHPGACSPGDCPGASCPRERAERGRRRPVRAFHRGGEEHRHRHRDRARRRRARLRQLRRSGQAGHRDRFAGRGELHPAGRSGDPHLRRRDPRRHVQCDHERHGDAGYRPRLPSRRSGRSRPGAW